jgi:small-conductance mechanosensitive channel
MVQTQIILTILTILVGLIISIILKKYTLKFSIQNEYKTIRKKLIGKIFNIIIFGGVIFIILFIWGIRLQNLWLTLTSILAIIAIGFVAVWSMLSNILASLIIFFTKPFRFGDNIKIMPEEISGKVVSIGLIFTTLKEKNKIVNIPNNLIMQRIIIKKIN